MNRAVYLDKDGTLIKDIPYNVDPRLISFEEGVIDGLKLLQENGFLLVVVSNQAGIAHGFFTETQFQRVRETITDGLSQSAINISGFFYCPHHPDAVNNEYKLTCRCRKPQPGMLIGAANELRIDCEQSWMIGDILDDIEAGNRAGCRTVLINNGNETKWELTTQRTPDHIAGNFFEAALFVLRNSAKQTKKHEQRLG